jgi:hypothetical protein
MMINLIRQLSGFLECLFPKFQDILDERDGIPDPMNDHGSVVFTLTAFQLFWILSLLTNPNPSIGSAKKAGHPFNFEPQWGS